MNRWLARGAGALALLGLAACGVDDLDEAAPDPGLQQPSAAPGAGSSKPQPYQIGEILVRWKSGVAAGRAAAVHARSAARILREYRVPSNLQLVEVPQGMTVEKALDAYRADPDVLYAEPNYIYQLDVTPNDPRFGELWGMHNTGQTGGAGDADINAPEAWSLSTGSGSVVVGVLDTGVDYTHPDLAGNIFTNPGEIAGNGLDDDGNGWIDDVHGIDAIADGGDPMDTAGHGTHVSGTIAARGDNGVGVVGVSWNATIVGCRAFDSSGSLDDILQCMDYFLDLKTRPNNPVDIVATNNSWGGGPFSQALYDAIGAHRQAGMLFVAAAGNDSSDTDAIAHYPSSYDHDNIISVLATNHLDERAWFSNHGAITVDVGAPGEAVLSTLPGNSYGVFSGTSMATPHVTGLVALLKAQDPARGARPIKNLILTGGTPTAATTGASLSGRRIRADGSLGCTNQSLVNRFAPAASSIITGVGTPVLLGVLSITCEAPGTEPQVVTVVETGATIPLVDAGGTGQFEGTYTPASAGTVTLSFSSGGSVTVTAVGNYDPARVVPFELAAITGTQLPLTCDDCVATIESPFPIRFAGAEPGLTTLHVGSNGILSFSSPIADFGNQPLPVSGYATIVAPLWDDLYPVAGGSIVYEVLGQAPSRQLVIEYRGVPHISGGGAATFQVVFFEGRPDLRFNYADVVFESPAYDLGASATVGVQVMSSVARQFSFNTPALSDNLSLLWTMGAPIAAAGPDLVVLPGADVELDGSNSHDFDGTIVSYAWTQIAGTPVALGGADTATPSFQAPSASGTLTFRLEVTDDEGKTGSDTVDVIVNRPPVAVPGDDLRVGTNLTATLDGTGSYDPDSAIVGYQWTQIHGEPVQLQNAGTQVATFTAPATAQYLVFRLTVTDEHGFTGSDVVVVDVFLNLPPVVDPGRSRIVRPGASVTLDGSGSRDPDGTIVSYAWTVVGCHTATGACSLALEGADTATPSFTAPGSPAFITLSLTVTDDAGATATAFLPISVFYQAPSAVIVAATACAQGGSTITLDGSHSLDADGGIVAYAWTQLSGPPVAIDNAGGAIASVTAPAQGTLVFQLQVTDGDGLTGTAQVTIPIDAPPVASASASASVVLAGATVTLDGSQSTDAAVYRWRQTAGTPVVLSDAGAVSPTFVAASPAGPFESVTFELTVTDACGATSTDTVTIVVVAG